MREHGILTITESEWSRAKQRKEVIAPLAQQDIVGPIAVEEAAVLLGITTRHVYRLIRRYRAGNGLVTDLASSGSDGGKGKARIRAEVELIVSDVLKELYLTRQRRSRAVITREIRKRCLEAGHRPPSYNTIDLRITLLDPIVATRKRQGGNAARRLQPITGETPEAAVPLEVVQIDHTSMDVIVVDEVTRLPIGRPSLTLAIDVSTRCIVGMLLTLEAPSATSVGLCLVHVVTDKSGWLEHLGLDVGLWPMHGKMKKIHLDNAPEFKSEALKRGCEQHGIERDYRPKRQPHYGGIIERVIGTAMKRAHELPGTTFSNIQERGTYKSEAKASLTLAELEKWLVLAVATYHNSVHGSLLEPPAAVWARSTTSWKITDIVDKQGFLIDFLPVIKRSITRTGFVIDYINYYGDALKPWIARRDSLEKFIIRRDPRDLSRVWVLDPLSKLYFEIQYRSLSHPAVTIWEHKRAIENLRKRGRDQVDEFAIFNMIDEMRELSEKAVKDTKRARRDKSRRAHLACTAQDIDLPVPTDEPKERVSIKPFCVEEWTDIPSPSHSPVPEDKRVLTSSVKPFDTEPFDNEEW